MGDEMRKQELTVTCLFLANETPVGGSVEKRVSSAAIYRAHSRVVRCLQLLIFLPLLPQPVKCNDEKVV